MKKRAIYSQDLGIQLRTGQEAELFKWFLACLLFGKPIQQEVARRTYLEFVKEGLTNPAAIRAAGWDKLVEVLDRGHYVRYDFSTATKLLNVCRKLQEESGSLCGLLRQCPNKAELGRRLQGFKGVGPVTARIFMRDLESLWPPRSKQRRAPTHRRRPSKSRRRA